MKEKITQFELDNGIDITRLNDGDIVLIKKLFSINYLEWIKSVFAL